MKDPALNYEVDSDEEWGEEPEDGEELASEGENEGNERTGEETETDQHGHIRSDGLEEDGFLVPEEEDQMMLGGINLSEAKVMKAGGKTRVIITPQVVGPLSLNAEDSDQRRYQEMLKTLGMWQMKVFTRQCWQTR